MTESEREREAMSYRWAPTPAAVDTWPGLVAEITRLRAENEEALAEVVRLVDQCDDLMAANEQMLADYALLLAERDVLQSAVDKVRDLCEKSDVGWGLVPTAIVRVALSAIETTTEETTK